VENLKEVVLLVGVGTLMALAAIIDAIFDATKNKENRRD